MSNPFSIIRLLMKSRRPSRIVEMKAVVDAFWLKKGYEALTFFGTIVTSTTREADRMNSHYDALKNHEMIHLRQAQSCHDSWLLFYVRYLWYWLCGLTYIHKQKNAGYVLNPFEMEAYEHMYDLHYLDDKPNGTTIWKEYASMPLSQRKHIHLHSKWNVPA